VAETLNMKSHSSSVIAELLVSKTTSYILQIKRQTDENANECRQFTVLMREKQHVQTWNFICAIKTHYIAPRERDMAVGHKSDRYIK